MENVRVRFAPSPTGWMHIGSIRQIIYNYLWAKKTDGKFVLRIEDTDVKRTVQGGIDAIYEVFNAFGIEVDEGPRAGGDHGPYVQSQRLDIYKKYAQELIKKDAAYYCFCSQERLDALREQQKQRKQQPMYDRHCRDLSPEEIKKKLEAGEPCVVRLKVPLTGVTEYEDVLHGKMTFKNSVIDDQILLKSDGFPTYHFAAVVDDHLMNISHVLRGEEYVSSTPKVVLMYRAFGWEIPYLVQAPNVLNPDGRKKLSKRGGSNTALKFLRKGYLVEALWNFLVLLGWAPSDAEGNRDQIYSREELVKLFDFRRVQKAGARFMPEKLEYFNGHYIRELSIEDLMHRVFEWADRYVLHEFVSDTVIGLLDWEKQLVADVKQYQPMWKKDTAFFREVLALVQERMKYLSEIPELTGFLFEEHLDYAMEEFETVGKDVHVSDLHEVLTGLWEKLEPIVKKEWTQESWEATIRTYADELGWKHGDLFMLLRIAIAGRRISPPLFESMRLMGVDRCGMHVDDARKFLENAS